MTTICDLPEAILIHILSFLPLPQPIQTSLVSRKFTNLWHSIPSLHFTISDFYSRHPRCDLSRHLFAEFVSTTLFLRPPSPLTLFALTFEYTNFHHHKSYVHNWIRHVISFSVQEIRLDFSNDQFYCWSDSEDEEDQDGHRLCDFEFDMMDIRKGCVKALALYDCVLQLPPKKSNVEFVSLKSLVLSVKFFEFEGVCDVLARCVNLEILKLKCMEFESEGALVIHSSTLKELYIASCSSVGLDCSLDLDICCPLRKIGLFNLDVGKYVNKDTTLLVEGWFDFLPFFRKENYNESWETMLRYFSNISSLHAWAELLESNEVPAGCELIASNVKHLELYCAYNENDLVGLSALLKLLPKLETLGLRNRGVNDENLHKDYKRASTFFNMPCLKKVILRKYQKTKSEQHFIKLFKKNGIVLEKIVLLHFDKEEYDKLYEGTIRVERRIKFARP